MDYKWKIRGKAKNIKEILNCIMEERNLTKEQMLDFIKNKPVVHDPFLFRDMKPAIERIRLAIKNGEIICVAGDYDCDGVTSTYTMYTGLKHAGANVIYRLPHRVHDGYGLKNTIVDFAKENGATLIITVDNGIAAPQAVDYAKSLNIDVIVTDHHQPQEVLPDCLIINPAVDKNYPFAGLCGCGVAFKVISALIPDFENTPLYNHLIEIVAIGTAADAMQLVDENRTFIIKGLERINNTSHVGLQHLFKISGLEGKKLDVDNIGFFIGPNINAAGRVDSPDTALDLFLSDDDYEAEINAKKLLALNDMRKDLQKKAISKLKVNQDDACIIGVIDDANAIGIAGIIASKMVETYKKPCFIFHNNNGMMSGSGRTFGDFHVIDCIDNHRDIVEGGGGHPGACGVKLKQERLEEFRKACNYEFSEWLKNNPDGLIPTIESTCEVDFSLVNERLISNMNKLKPFGNGNPEPLFVSKDVEVIRHKVVGKKENVIQLELRQGFYDIKSVGFESFKDKYIDAGCPEKIDILYTIGLNEWPQGTFKVQLILSDFK